MLRSHRGRDLCAAPRPADDRKEFRGGNFDTRHVRKVHMQLALLVMQTTRLRWMADPKQAQTLLDSYVASAAKLPAAARKQMDLVRLPQALQEQADRAIENGLVWSAWSHGRDSWLFVGQLNLDRARERAQPVMEIDAYDYERRTKVRLVTMRGRDGTWQALKE